MCILSLTDCPRAELCQTEEHYIVRMKVGLDILVSWFTWLLFLAVGPMQCTIFFGLFIIGSSFFSSFLTVAAKAQTLVLTQSACAVPLNKNGIYNRYLIKVK